MILLLMQKAYANPPSIHGLISTLFQSVILFAGGGHTGDKDPSPK
jgi:hypothetical protein